jgi:TolB-like protein
MMEARSVETVTINGVTVDFGNETLRTTSQESVPLRPQAFAVLRYLVTHAGRLITKDELMRVVWPGVAVTDDSLVQCVHEIRRVLQDNEHKLLKTAPRRGYRLMPIGSPIGEHQAVEHPTLGLPDRPSIAVLPFQNMSGEAEQDYFADGMVEEIITALSRMRWLFVIARNSSFAYKGRSLSVKRVGRELGVRYVLEGSVRKARSKVRITGQLIDTSTGAHLWADRFDGLLDDVFDLQDRVAERVIGAIAPKLEQVEIERARRKPTERLDAYDYFLRGMAAFHQWTREANREALELFSKAVQIDSGFAAAYALAARCYAQRKSSGWVTDRHTEIEEAGRLARRGAGLGRDDAVALTSAGIALAFVVGDLESGSAYIDRALGLNPNLAWAWLANASVKVWAGDSDAAIESALHAMRLSPNDPQIFVMHSAMAAAHFIAGRYSQALQLAGMSARERPDYVPSAAWASASAALIGDVPAAERAIVRLRRLVPELRVSNLAELFPIRRVKDFRNLAKGLRMAGLPK